MTGAMDVCTAVNGKMGSCTVTANTSGKRARAMKVNLFLTKNMATGFTLGLMDVLIKDIGKMENNMVSQSILSRLKMAPSVDMVFG